LTTIRPLSWQDISNTTEKLSKSLAQAAPFARMIAVTRGGLVPAGLLAHRLNIKNIQTINVESYIDTTQNSVQGTSKNPFIGMSGEEEVFSETQAYPAVCAASDKISDAADRPRKEVFRGVVQFLSDVQPSNERCLVVDELVDTGKTLAAIRALFPNAVLATLYAKPLGKPFVDVFVEEVPQETWLSFPWECS
jgi:xanthine phosphoribosyltransferase